MINLMDKYTIVRLKKKGLSNRKVAEQLGVDRKTVATHWNNYLAEAEKLKDPDYDMKKVQEAIVEKPTYNSANRKPRKYTPEIDQALDLILESEVEKLHLLGSNKQKLTVVQIYEALVAQGFDIGKTTISTKISQKRAQVKACFIKQDYAFGERLEYDFGEVKLYINNQTITCHMAVLSSPAGAFRWAYLYKNQNKDVFMDSHVRFFDMVGGVYQEVVYDNMRNVVTKFLGKNEKQLNEDLIKLSLYYGFDINLTNAYKGNEKGHVEGSVKVIRNKIFGPKYKFSSFEEAAHYLQDQLIWLNAASSIEDEKKHLLPYKPKFELATMVASKVNTYSFVRIDNNDYSVPDYLVGKTVSAKCYYDHIAFYANHHFICEHKRVDGSNETCIDIRHYLSTFEKKPGALSRSFALKSIPRLKSIYDIYFKGKSRAFIALLQKYKDNEIEKMVELIDQAIKTHPQMTVQKPSQAIACLTQSQILRYHDLTIKEVH